MIKTEQHSFKSHLLTAICFIRLNFFIVSYHGKIKRNETACHIQDIDFHFQGQYQSEVLNQAVSSHFKKNHIVIKIVIILVWSVGVFVFVG